ncbi:MAG TPA: acetamidase/formamidase family protein [Tissierellia bacterium]|nr:acetamidase/formamidase family protein [Tissierellia bacterium]
MLGPVEDGGYIIANTSPGCWGPMITPELKGRNEVTVPVYVAGAEVGDGIAIYIKSIQVTSSVIVSGTDSAVEGKFVDDPYVVSYCEHCDISYPESIVEGIGDEAIKCKQCGKDVATFKMVHGYTMAFDESSSVGVTLHKEAAEKVAKDARKYIALPPTSVQHPATLLAPTDMVGTIARVRPFLGQCGTAPSIAMPDTHNSGDFGSFLEGVSHEYALTAEQLKEHKTDAHMDLSRVRAGAVVIAPVKVPGGGVFVGDVHAMQGDGEIAGHTTDVSALVVLKVKVIKGLHLDGPIVLPLEEDLPHLAKPFTKEELLKAKHLAEQWGLPEVEESAPVSFIGTGANLNLAIGNALERAAKFLDVTVDEIKNRATITGSVEIARAPGSAVVTFLAPVSLLKKAGIYEVVKEQYTLE